ncbi:CotH kinase family protein [Clostridium botulinum]|uniref:CotH kinase family protein n=1 Tax=Clostridium botulinum TaxID=1491 RepID=UPI002246EE7C|nr:CotH kinase family protein [Clostridium botulinum]UZP03520.1 CotH kinase family protein [Clostridium botulinum]UZP06876.1 CotH kinase family protein [Clostridium botulinum]UZP10258.1 CotH kinase family protein [Clostridium botulinum]
MIKEKYKGYISITSMILAVILIFSLVVNNETSSIAQKKLSTVLDKESITNIDIDIEESDWNWLIENALNEEFRSCNITINGETFYNVGIRPKGNTSLTSVASDDTTDRYSFKIKFDKYVDGQTYHGLESIVLNNIIQDSTYMKEYITYDLYESLGVATPEMSYSNITVNNENWGLYLAIEVIDERYLENNFGSNEGNLYKPETMGVNNGGGNQGGNPPNGGERPTGLPPGVENNQGNMTMPSQGGQETQQNINDKNISNTQQDLENVSEMKMPTGEKINATAEKNTSQDDNISNKEITKLNETTNNEMPQMGGNKMGGRAVEGADFVYIDDNVSSYSIVRESAVLKRTTDADFEKVINMFKNLNEGTNLEEVLDVEEVLKYFAVNTFVINLDSYSGAMYHNYYLYEKDGKCQMLPWDLNLSFGGFGARGGNGGNQGNASSESSVINFPIDNPVSGDLSSMPLIGKLLEVDEYKEMYHSYLKQIADEYFNNGYYENLVNKIDNLISSYVENDPTAFCTYDEYKNSIPEMIKFGEDRTKSVLAQLNGEQPSTTYGTIESTVNMTALGDMGGGKGMQGNKTNNVIQNTEQKISTEITNKDNVENTQVTNENLNKEVPNVINQDNTNANNQANIPNQDMMQENQLNDTINQNENKTTQIEENKNSENNNVQNNMHKQNFQHVDNGEQNKSYLLILGGLIVLSGLSLLFVSKFKRKKLK